MDKPVKNYWELRLEDLKASLEDNNFETYIAQTSEEARDLVLNNIIPKKKPASISWGGSITFTSTGLYHELKDRTDIDVLDTYDKSISMEENLERRRQALHTDLFFTGTNAITETGILINLDMIGNRVAALTFGPKNVVVMAGRNKIVPDLDTAMDRIKNYAAPVNNMRLDMKTPCAKTGFCEECKSPDRICNNWTITEKSFPKGRINVVLINEDLGF
ncbi:MAG: lactate utilization protein [Desulfobacterales bacterium]|nr:lactate utilization protein [Desulfobacteraceae bacterium]MBT4364793.1 lactate utilization protein [Desulfobacteraceae bacterium]MBT7085326.1 lactate utilization protein [Desulfobacterales bacterium]MBT7698220.1 lactate utilization protein [Desulfobacterales bacterium]